MKISQILWALLAIFTTIGIWGCSNSSEDGKKTKLQIPWPSADGKSYESQEVEVTSLKDVNDMEGSAAKIYLSPGYDAEDGGFPDKGMNFRFVKKGEVHIPANTETLQVATVYAHFDRFIDFDKQVGVYDLIPRPRKVGVNVNFTIGDREEPERDNALYDSRTDSLLMVPYESKELPLTINAGILAHEHFHSLFQRLVYDVVSKGRLFSGHRENLEGEMTSAAFGNTGLSIEEFNILMFRSVNEGLADLWAWIYMGDPVFVGRSLPDHIKSRRLDSQAVQLPTLEAVKKRLSKIKKGRETGYAYRLGTQYARFFHKVATSSKMAESREERVKIAKRIVAGLKVFAKKTQKIWAKDGVISPELFIQSFEQANPEFSKKAKNCLLFSEFLLASRENQEEGACL